MKKKIFSGVATAIVTPFDNAGEIDYKTFSNLIEFQISNKVDAIVVCGTTGEASTLTNLEHLRLVEYAVDSVNGRIPVIAGSGSNNTKRAVELTREVSKLGCDGALIVTPYYNKASQSGLIEHYSEISDKSDIPIILYNVPTRTGVDIQPETVLELSEKANILALKEASFDVSKITAIRRLCKDEISIYSGNDDLMLPLLSLGASGVISVAANIIPSEMRLIYSYFEGGQISDAEALNRKYYSFMKALFSDVNPIPVKTALGFLNMCGPIFRLPLSAMSEEKSKKMTDIMAETGIIG